MAIEQRATLREMIDLIRDRRPPGFGEMCADTSRPFTEHKRLFRVIDEREKEKR